MSSVSTVGCMCLDNKRDCWDNEVRSQLGKKCRRVNIPDCRVDKRGYWVGLGCCSDGLGCHWFDIPYCKVGLVYRRVNKRGHWVDVVYFLVGLGCYWDDLGCHWASLRGCWDGLGCCWVRLGYCLDCPKFILNTNRFYYTYQGYLRWLNLLILCGIQFSGRCRRFCQCRTKTWRVMHPYNL